MDNPLSTQAFTLKQNADDLRNQGKTKEAIEKYQETIQLFDQVGDKNKVAEMWQMIGVCHKMENNLPRAIEALQVAVKLFEDIHDDQGLGNTYRDIAITYTYDHQFSEALPWFEKSIHVLEKTDDTVALGITTVKRGLTYVYLKRYEDAEEDMRQGLSLIRSKGNWFMEMTALLNYAGLDAVLERFDDALNKLWAAFGILLYEGEQEQQSRRVAQIFGLLALCYLKLGNREFAIKFLTNALELLKGMSEEIRKPVYEDINLASLLNELDELDKESIEKLKHNFAFIKSVI